MSMPSFLTTPREVECAALLSDVYMCMGVSDRVSVISQSACREIYFKKPCIQLFSHIFCYRYFLSKIFEKGSAAIYGPYPHKRSHFISLTRASRCTPQLCSFLFFGGGSLCHSVIHQQEMIAKTKSRCLTTWPFHCLIFGLVPFYDERMANPWRQVPYISIIYLQGQVFLRHLLNFI